MDKLVLDGKTYVLASKAAADAGYTRDYVGQLARGGKVDAHLVGRSWYVNIDQLGEHRIETKRNARVKAREQVRREVLKVQEEVDPAPQRKHYLERSIRYEGDQNELIPAVKRVEVVSERPKIASKSNESRKSDKGSGKNYTIENKGEKILMSGKVDIVDATDEDALDEDTVFLQAHVNKKRKKISTKTKARANEKILKLSVHEEESDEESEVPMRSEDKTEFITKLENLEQQAKGRENSVDIGIEEKEEIADPSKHGKSHAVSVSAIFVLSLAASIALVVLETRLQYLDMGTGDTSEAYYDSSYGFKIRTLADDILHKI